MESNYKTQTGWIVFSQLLLIMMLVSSMSNSRLLLIVFLAACMITFFKPVYLLPCLIVSSLLGEYFVLASGVGISRIIVVLFILFCAVRTKKLSKEFLILVVLVNLTNLISLGFAVTTNTNTVVLMLMNTLVFIMAFNLVVPDMRVLSRILISTSVISTIFFIILLLKDPNYLAMSRVTISEDVNVNAFAIAISQIAAIKLGYLYLNERLSRKLIIILMLFVDIYLLILTGTRSALIGVAAAYLVLSIVLLFKRKNIENYYSGTAVLFTVFTTFYLYISRLGLGVLDRYTIESVSESGGTGRVDVWSAVFKYILPERYLFGVGLGGINVYNALLGLVVTPRPAHNIIIDMLAQVGVFGSIIYLAFFGKVLSKSFRNITPYMIIPCLMVLAALFNGIGETMFSEKPLWNALALCAIVISNTKIYNNNTKMHAVEKRDN